MSDREPSASVSLQEQGTSRTGGAYGFTSRVGIERLTALRGPGWWDAIREMSEQDATIRAILFAIEMTMRRVTFTTKAASDEQEAKDWAERCEGALSDMEQPWPDTLSEVMTFIPYGKALFELVYKRCFGDDSAPEFRSQYDDGLYGWRKWGYRPPETQSKWLWEDGSLVGWQQRQEDGSTVDIPIEKLLNFRSAARGGNPDGLSMLMHVYVPWYNKSQIQTDEAIGIGRDLAGLFQVMVPDSVLEGKTTEDARMRDYWKKAIRNVRRGTQEGIMSSSARDRDGNLQTEVKLLTSGGIRQFDTSKIVERYRSEIVTGFLAGFMLLGQGGGGGSYALGETLADFFSRCLSAWLDMICERVTDAMHRLSKANGKPRALWPTYGHGDPDSADLQALGGFLVALETAGLLQESYDLVKAVHEVAGLPVPSQDDYEGEKAAKAERAKALAAQLQKEPAPTPTPEPVPAPGGSE